MPTIRTYPSQEFNALYGQLSERKQDELFAYLRLLVRQEEQSSSVTQEKDEALERLIGCAAGAVKEPLSIEKMNEIAAAGWAGEL